MKQRPAALAALLCLAAAPNLHAAAPAQYLTTPGPARPFSAAVRAGDSVYASGAIGIGDDGKLPADFPTQARNAMHNLDREFAMAGASIKDATRCSVLLSDMKNWAAFNVEYVKFFTPGHLPARVASGANGLALDAAVEVQCDAYAPLTHP